MGYAKNISRNFILTENGGLAENLKFIQDLLEIQASNLVKIWSVGYEIRILTVYIDSQIFK